jgi:hypothetical protein
VPCLNLPRAVAPRLLDGGLEHGPCAGG